MQCVQSATVWCEQAIKLHQILCQMITLIGDYQLTYSKNRHFTHSVVIWPLATGQYFDESRTRHLCPYFLLLSPSSFLPPPPPPPNARQGCYKTFPMFVCSYISKLIKISPIMCYFSSIFWNYKWQYWMSIILHATCTLFPFILIFTIPYVIFSVCSSRIISPQISSRAKFYFQNIGYRDPM